MTPGGAGRGTGADLAGPAAEGFSAPARSRFKFVTGEHLWLRVPNDAPNAATDEQGQHQPPGRSSRTGRHLWRFTTAAPVDLARPLTIALADGASAEPLPVGLGYFFRGLATDLPLGARVARAGPISASSRPRAERHAASLPGPGRPGPGDRPRRSPAARTRTGPTACGSFLTLERELHGWYYWYTLDGTRTGPDGFDPGRRILDPYALAAVGPAGPGIVLSRSWVGRADRRFRTPAWQDLVIAEAHVRDLAANAPVATDPLERRGFTGLRRWVESPEFYLHALGVNCVELQPIQQSDTALPETYGWGYMTTNFFAPEASYSIAPAEASGVRELQDLIAAFHRRGIAVLADVVFNHVGMPAHLMAIDRRYYFEQDHEAGLSNWSGCGNDLRADARPWPGG